MTRKAGLGRGLSALMGDSEWERGKQGEQHSTGGPLEISMDEISANPFQPRKAFAATELAELAESVRVYGVLQPVVLRAQGKKYEIIAGERRVRAAKIAGLATVPAWVRDASDEEMIALALVENLQREDLNPLEEAEAYSRLAAELGWTQEEIAGRVGKSRSHVANYFRLLQLDAGIQDSIRQGRLTMAHAKALLTVEDEGARRALAERAVAEGWSVRELERRKVAGLAAVRPAAEAKDIHLAAIEEGLRRALGAGVWVRGDGRQGRIEIRYGSVEELERLLGLLSGAETVGGQFTV